MRLLTTKQLEGGIMVTGMSTAMTVIGMSAAMTETGMMQMARAMQMAVISSVQGSHLICLLVTVRTAGILLNLIITDLNTLKMPGIGSLTLKDTIVGDGMTLLVPVHLEEGTNPLVLVHLEDGTGLVVLLDQQCCVTCSGSQDCLQCNDYSAAQFALILNSVA